MTGSRETTPRAIQRLIRPAPWTFIFTAGGASGGGYMIATGRPGMIIAGLVCAITGVCMTVVWRDVLRRREAEDMP